ncbi:putative UPF0481 protein At3g02645 [Phoenix dactylifera]|uniref:UPF0481 protein At3g02645 n=1 Tax=Phoenix dactylifera TaxID=42345 RepID=A0A8B9ANN1_PHODC|nr:putative UPF0481 protein At3g02645 [Phoenix dactylifera]
MDGRRPPTEANQHVAMEINTPWLESIKYRAGMSMHRKPPAEPTIFRVPPDMRCGNRGAYEPKLVSIGPYHRGKSEDLKAMEELKWRLLHHYLSKVPDGSRNEGLRKMKDLEVAARNCYSEVIDLDSNQFVEMLLLDGCFLIQIFITYHAIANTDESTYDGNDLQAEELISLQKDNKWFLDLIPQDLLLLENQLPYFIVEHLLDTLVMPGWNSSRLQQVAISLFADLVPQYFQDQQPTLPDQGFQVDHLLHLFHKWILSVPKLGKARNTRSCTKLLSWCCNSSLSEGLPCFTEKNERLPPTVPTATELAEARNTRSCTKLLSWCCNSSLSVGLPCFTEKNERLPPTVPTATELAEARNTRSCTKLLSWCCNSLLSEGLPCFTEKNERLPPTVPTATELAEAGVEIKVRKFPARNGAFPAIEIDDQTISFLDISFCKDRGVLEIPAIEIDDRTNMVLANLTALEQCCLRHKMDITHYTLFLDDIINTPRDVQLLHQEGIIYRSLGADEDIASLFNKLGSGVNYDPQQNYLQGVYEDLNAYCQSRCHRWRAKAVRDYFGNPWAIISLGAAVLLLGLTILQSVYGVLDYYKM